jgi:hypothetical protein
MKASVGARVENKSQSLLGIDCLVAMNLVVFQVAPWASTYSAYREWRLAM